MNVYKNSVKNYFPLLKPVVSAFIVYSLYILPTIKAKCKNMFSIVALVIKKKKHMTKCQYIFYFKARKIISLWA